MVQIFIPPECAFVVLRYISIGMGAQSQIRGILSLCRARLGKELAVVALGQAGSAIGTLLSLRVLTEYLSPHEFGNFALGLTVIMLLQYAYMGVSAALLKYYSAAVENSTVEPLVHGVWKVYTSRHVVLAIMLAVGSAIIIATKAWIWFLLGIPCAFAAVLVPAGVIHDSIQLASRNRLLVAGLAAVTPWITLLCQLVCIMVLGTNAFAALVGVSLGTAVLVPVRAFASRTKIASLLKGSEKPDGEATTFDYFPSMKAYAFPWLLWAFPMWVQLNADRWALDAFRSTGEVGVYAGYSQLAIYPITMLTQVLLQFVQPVLYNRVGTGSDSSRVESARKLNLKLVKMSLIWTAVMSVIVFQFAKPIAHVFLAPQYRDAHDLLWLLVISAGFYATSNFAALLITTSEDTQKLLAPRITTAVFGTGLIVFAAWRYGGVGVAVASAVAWLAYTVWVLIKADVSVREMIK